MGVIKDRLRTDLTTSIKARDSLRSSTLRMVLSAVTNAEVAGKEARELSDEDVLGVLTTESKKRREAAEAFDGAGRTEQAAKERAEAEVIAGYLPEQLSEEEIVVIVDLMLKRVDTALKNKDMGLEVTTPAKALLAKKGYDPVLGARPLRRTIQREIEDNLSEQILFGTLKAGEIVVVDVEGEGEEQTFTFRGEPKPVSVPDVPPVDLAGGPPLAGGVEAVE